MTRPHSNQGEGHRHGYQDLRRGRAAGADRLQPDADHDRNGMIYTLAEHEDELRAIRDGWPDPFPNPIDDPDRRPRPASAAAPVGASAPDATRKPSSTRCCRSNPNADSTSTSSSSTRWSPTVPCVGWNYLSGTTTADAGPADHAAYNTWTYRWYCDEEFGTVGYADTPGAVLLCDRADVRTHRHRGLVGALVVEPASVTPSDPRTGRARWTGGQAVLRRQRHEPEREFVLIVQDGLRHYHHGDTTQPVSYLQDSIEDRGQKAISYRSAHLLPSRPSLAVADPSTPILECAPGDAVRLHLVVAADFPRGHSFHIHGQTWPMADHLAEPRVGAVAHCPLAASGQCRSLRVNAATTPTARGRCAGR